MKFTFILRIVIILVAIQLCVPLKLEAQVNKGGKNPTQLRKKLSDIISNYKATVGLSVLELETGDSMSINNNIPFAMQSVFKFPLALAVLNEVEKGKISLKDKVFVSKKMVDRLSSGALKRQNPGSNFYMSVDSLLMYTIAYSDNLACDLLFEVIGGTKVADKFMHQLGYPDIHIKFTELEFGRKPARMYKNSSIPSAMTSLLKAFYERKIISETSTRYLLNFMIKDSTTHKRILGNLPPGTIVAHKTGTGSLSDTLINACNDVGIITMPNGKHLAISVFVMDAKEKYDDTEKLIAILTKEVFDYYR